MSGYLSKIKDPSDIKQFSIAELKELADELRSAIQSTVFKTGGHFASNFGAIELSIAMHYVFNSPRDKLVWDTGHQAYPHKLLTGRYDRFDTIRQYEGLSGFLSREESVHDSFGAGHASTSISAAFGMAMGRDLKGEDYDVIAIIGDGALTGGMAFEALNNAGTHKSPFIVVLNDNEMSISKNVGALSKYLDRVRADPMYLHAKDEAEHALNKLPMGGEMVNLAKRVKRGFKDLVVPSTIWEELGFIGLGPVDGHDIELLIETFELARKTRLPVFIHAITVKGKGWAEAEASVQGRIDYHARSNKLSVTPATTAPNYDKVFGDTMCKIAEKDPKVVAITAAMTEGTGLLDFAKRFPERFFDVGIAEQHGVTFAAGLACEGIKPVAAIYSSFLQRAFDQIVHDCCIQNLPVVFAMDRAGLVGDDGRTHQGTLDISYLRCLPNIVLMAPKDENELQHMLYTAVNYGLGPVAVRYPRGAGYGVAMDGEFKALPIGKGEVLRQGGDLAIVAYGSEVYPALEAATLLAEHGVEAEVINARFAKPLDEELLLDLARRHTRIVTVEEGSLIGGFGTGLLELLEQKNMQNVTVRRLGIPDSFIDHGPQSLIREKLKLNALGIADRIRELYPELAKGLPATLN
ncbi:1-deoxy-D-xylulose-5-phosphate synthase [Candidatus Chlorohelix sp.]|uniref:1-deoxy-D-xylulose-5-phosphate synthase n=1 Tax=Candidatus Chlorohelix sp. TaxID=3139201 RepID=UPI003057B9B7